MDEEIREDGLEGSTSEQEGSEDDVDKDY